MKCKACNGTGKINAIDFAKPNWKDTEEVCPICCGRGAIEQTKEEWFCTLPTHEKAYYLADMCAWAMEEFRCGNTEKANIDYWEKWLIETQ